MKMSHLLVPIVAVAGMAFAGSVTPFNLDLSGFGPTIYTVQSQTVASGLDYPYGMAAIGNGSILFGESTPKTAGGIEGGPSTGSVWLCGAVPTLIDPAFHPMKSPIPVARFKVGLR